MLFSRFQLRTFRAPLSAPPHIQTRSPCPLYESLPQFNFHQQYIWFLPIPRCSASLLFQLWFPPHSRPGAFSRRVPFSTPLHVLLCSFPTPFSLVRFNFTTPSSTSPPVPPPSFFWNRGKLATSSTPPRLACPPTFRASLLKSRPPPVLHFNVWPPLALNL